MSAKRILDRWTVDYGDGRLKEVRLPHAWKTDLPIGEEGPVSYKAKIHIPKDRAHLVCDGVSYAAEVLIDGMTIARHEGIWDAFSVPLAGFQDREVVVEIRVTKNGGPSYPVRDVASGFLPYVFHTFGGLYADVELVLGDDPLAENPPAPPTRLRVDGSKIYVDERPFYPRGLLHWGWYPELGHTNPPEETIRREVRAARDLGFNLVKFCLWVPPHRYLDILRREGMEAWLELPLWNPSPDPVILKRLAGEIERIVRQYRRHDNIIIWTAGCELPSSIPASFRADLYATIRNLTGCPLVKDNSGGAEMYGGDLREFGDFYDFHPYCDTPFYPAVLDSLLPGARRSMPVLLGEFNDVDVHRNLARTHDEGPYWASSLGELNAQGVRWRQDLPEVLSANRFANEPGESRHSELMASSRSKALFMRKIVHEWVRARSEISGYVDTGWRDTPISSAGFFDDWGHSRFSRAETQAWNGPSCLFLIPSRRPPFVAGGNRPGFVDPFNHFAGQIFWRVGVHSEHALSGGLLWTVLSADGSLLARGMGEMVRVEELSAVEVGQIDWTCEEAGAYRLVVEFGSCRKEWTFNVAPSGVAPGGWYKCDPAGLFSDLALPELHGEIEGANLIATRPGINVWSTLAGGGTVWLFLTDEFTKPVPFWREAAYEFLDERFWAGLEIAERWEKWLAISPDRVLDPSTFDAVLVGAGEPEVLMNRIDVRTYAEAPILIRAHGKPKKKGQRAGTLYVTTIRPFGGLGIQPSGVTRNPAGTEFLDRIMDVAENRE